MLRPLRCPSHDLEKYSMNWPQLVRQVWSPSSWRGTHTQGFGRVPRMVDGGGQVLDLKVVFERLRPGSVFLSHLPRLLSPLVPSLLVCITLLGSPSHWSV